MMVYSDIELIIAVAGAEMMFGTIGFLIGRSGLIETFFWSKCVFIGNPPEPYENWLHFCRSSVKADVTIRANNADYISSANKSYND